MTKQIIFFLFCILVVFTSNLIAQSTLSEIEEFIPQWQLAGCQSSIPQEDDLINVVSEFSADNSGLTNTWTAIDNAIIEAEQRVNNTSINICAVYLPAGTYYVKSQINMKSGVILRGDGSEETEIKVLIGDYNNQTSDDWEANGIKFNNVSNAGVEDLRIKRYDQFLYDVDGASVEDTVLDGEHGHNIYLRGGSNNWIIGVESDNSLHNHVMIRNSDHNLVSGCYIHAPQTHGEGGQGYGVAIYENSEYNLVENNIFKRCRHSMLLHNYARWNVFGYNYSREPHQSNTGIGNLTNGSFIGDMVCHGYTSGNQGPKENLFEGNIGRWIWVDGFHDDNGVHNTFFRNRASRYGVWIAKEYFNATIFWPWGWQDLNFLYDQPEQILINNYFRCKRWFASQNGFGRHIKTPHKPIEKNSRVKKRNFWGSYYTRWWSDNTYKKKYPELWDSEISYYIDTNNVPSFLNSTVPFDPYHDDYNPAKWRWDYGTSRTKSRRFDNEYTEVVTWSTNQTLGEDYEVNKGEQLIIEEGVTITFDDDAKLIIKGSLIAEGTETAPIVFTKRTEDNYWDGIHFGGDSEYHNYSVLRNCIIEYGNKNKGGGVYIKNYGNLSIENCQIMNCKANEYGGGIYLNNCSPKINNNIIQNNSSSEKGGGIYIVNDCNSEISGNSIVGNSAVNLGGGIYINESNPLFQDNKIAENVAGNSSSRAIDEFGGGVYLVDSRAEFVNNYICNNKAEDDGGAFYIRANSKPNIVGNIICNNEADDNGAGLFVTDDSEPILINNTISRNLSNNQDGSVTGAAIYANQDSDLISTNNIIWNNSPVNDQIYISSSSSLTAEHSDIQGGYSGTSNINSNPYFQQATSGYGINYDAVQADWSIIDNSPCRDSGTIDIEYLFDDTDLVQNPRIFPPNGSIDIGAIEYYEVGIQVDNTEIDFGSVPTGKIVKDTVWVKNFSNNNITINGITLTGNDESHFYMTNLPSSIPAQDSCFFMIYFNSGPIDIEKTSNIVINSSDSYLPELTLSVKAVSSISPGWNWICFPKLNRDSNGNQDATEVMSCFDPYAEYLYYENDYMRFSNPIWHHYGLNDISSEKAYKLDMGAGKDKYDLYSDGDLFGSTESVNLYAGQKNWIGYWLTESQNMDVAFGANFSHIASIKSEYWYYKPYGGMVTKGIEPSSRPSSKIHPLHYGNGYIVETDVDILNFKWHTSSNNAIKDDKQNSKSFSFTQDKDYEVIDVVGLSEDVIEIGAFADGICIGATVVDEPDEQILIYPISRNSSEIYFELVFEGRDQKSHIDTYASYDDTKECFTLNPVYTNSKDYSLVSLDDDVLEIPASACLIKNYPNPFNPDTFISFAIPENGFAEIEIFNVKGQKIDSILSKVVSAGRHQIKWDGKDSENNMSASGVYFYKLSVNGKSKDIKKMLLLK